MYDIIAIGSATRDIFLTSPLFKVLRDPEHLKKIGFEGGEAQCFALGGKIEIGPLIFATGGGATNAAVSFSRQALKAAALIKIGSDRPGEAILNELKKEKIKPFVIKEKKVPTAYSTILLAPSGERTILIHRGASENLKIKEIPFKKLKAGWVYVSPGKIPFPIIEKIFNHFSKNKTPIAFNPSEYFIEMGEKLKPLLNKAKVVFLNRGEAAKLTGVNYSKGSEIFKKMDELVDGIVAVTDDKKGAMISDGFNIYRAGVFKEKKLVDRTGAGDAFASGFVAGLIRKKEKCDKGLCNPRNIEYAIRLGSANATSVIEKIGAKAGILTKREFEKSNRWKHLPINIIKI